MSSGIGSVFLRGKSKNINKLIEAFDNDDTSKDYFFGISLIDDAEVFMLEDSGNEIVTGGVEVNYSFRLVDCLIKEYLNKWVFGEDKKTCLSIDKASKKYEVDIEIYGYDIENHLEEHFAAVDGEIVIDSWAQNMPLYLEFDNPESALAFPQLEKGGPFVTSRMSTEYTFSIPSSDDEIEDYYKFCDLLVFTLEKVKFSNSKEEALENIKDNPLSFKYLPKKLKEDKEIVLEVLSFDCDLMKFVPKKMQKDKDIVLASIPEADDHSYNSETFKKYPKEFREDKEIVLKAVKACGSCLYDAADRMKRDKEVAIAALSHYGFGIKLVSSELREDRDVVMAAASAGGGLEFFPERFKSDREVVMVDVSARGEDLKYVSSELKSDREIVLAAVKETGGSLKYASDELKSDKDFILSAVKVGGKWAFDCVPKKLREDPDVLTLIKK